MIFMLLRRMTYHLREQLRRRDLVPERGNWGLLCMVFWDKFLVQMGWSALIILVRALVKQYSRA